MPDILLDQPEKFIEIKSLDLGRKQPTSPLRSNSREVRREL
jgi:hypothetical protein